jgi:hypothetical protein
VGIDVMPNREMVLEPNREGLISMDVMVQYKEISNRFYLVLLNNITKYEAHFVEINITEPKLKIVRVYHHGDGNRTVRSHGGKY